MADSFADDRGTIEDLLVRPLDAVTRIWTRKGAVRGNHLHNNTVQYTYIVSGRLRVVTAEGDFTNLTVREYGPGDMAEEAPGVAHAWEALEDTTALVFTAGPRSGSNYESDTVRLEKPLIARGLRERSID